MKTFPLNLIAYKLPIGKDATKKLYLLCYVTTSQAAGAHLDSHGGSTDLSLYLNKVWLPSTACMII